MVGGDEAVYERVKPVLGVIGSDLIYCGGPGAGAVCKVVNNVHLFTIHAALAECLSLGVKAGVHVETLINAILLGSARSRPAQIFEAALNKPRFLDNPEGPMVSTALKDVRLGTELGAGLGVPMELAAVAERALADAETRGWQDMQYSAHVMVQERKAGVSLAPTPCDSIPP